MTRDGTDAVSGPQALDWGGLPWSPWHDFDQARDDRLIPETPGLYRLRATDEPGLLYIGEGGAAAHGRWGRLDDLARGRKRHPADYYLNWRAAGLTSRPHRGHYAAPYFRLCEDAGCHIDVSWALEEQPDLVDRRKAEHRLIQLHREVMGFEPPIQHGGRGLEAYLRRRGERDLISDDQSTKKARQPGELAVDGEHGSEDWPVTEYDYRNCQSLFGYAAKVHERSGGICQLCGVGRVELAFDLWRQMTVEHLIGESQGGYLRQISAALTRRFSQLGPAELTELARRIDVANTVTACSFCNATTSRAQAPISMTSLIERAPDGTPDQIFGHVTASLDAILAGKQKDVAWKLSAVREAFDSQVAPRLADARTLRASRPPVAVADADVGLVVARITSDVASAPEEFVAPPGYAHLSLALVDAVYSIRSRYPTVKRVVAAYGEASDTYCLPLAARSQPGFCEQGLDCLLKQARSLHGEALADRLFGGSRSRTAGRLKADVCVEASARLQAMSVTHIPDLHERADDADVRHAWTGVRGLGWVTWQYFCSLAGIDQLKPDVMLMRFVVQAMGREVSATETDALLSHAFEELLSSYPWLTKRILDHTIWHFERGQ